MYLDRIIIDHLQTDGRVTTLFVQPTAGTQATIVAELGRGTAVGNLSSDGPQTLIDILNPRECSVERFDVWAEIWDPSPGVAEVCSVIQYAEHPVRGPRSESSGRDLSAHRYRLMHKHFRFPAGQLVYYYFVFPSDFGPTEFRVNAVLDGNTGPQDLAFDHFYLPDSNTRLIEARLLRDPTDFRPSILVTGEIVRVSEGVPLLPSEELVAIRAPVNLTVFNETVSESMARAVELKPGFFGMSVDVGLILNRVLGWMRKRPPN